MELSNIITWSALLNLGLTKINPDICLTRGQFTLLIVHLYIDFNQIYIYMFMYNVVKYTERHQKSYFLNMIKIIKSHFFLFRFNIQGFSFQTFLHV